jgi:hypothetical protein
LGEIGEEFYDSIFDIGVKGIRGMAPRSSAGPTLPAAKDCRPTAPGTIDIR